MARDKVYTRAGDDGTTGLLYGGRVPKDSALPRAYGAVDEAQAVLGLVRAESGKGSELDDALVHIMRDLWVLMGELATDPANRDKLTAGATYTVTAAFDSATEAARLAILFLTAMHGGPRPAVRPGASP